MTDDRINHPQVEQSVPGGDSDSGEEAAVPVVRAVGRFGRECEPYILPLFPLESEQMMGRDGDGRPPINQSVSQIFGCTTSLSFDISVRSASIFAHSDTRSSRLTPIKRSNPFCLSDHVLHFLQFDICGRNESQEIDWCQRTAQTIYRSVSWLCKAMGSDDVALHWRLPASSGMVVVREGDCDGRVCVDENVLTVRYLHPGDSGRYTCVAKNKYGQDQRQVALKVEVRKKE